MYSIMITYFVYILNYIMLNFAQISFFLGLFLPLKAFLNRSNISSNIKMSCWMTCRIGLTDRKNSKWRNFQVGYVYFLFHSTFHSYDVISNVRTWNFEWFYKTKTLCKTITIKKSHTSNRNQLEQQQRRFWPSI